MSPLLYLMDTGVFPIKRRKAQLGLAKIEAKTVP